MELEQVLRKIVGQGVWISDVSTLSKMRQAGELSFSLKLNFLPHQKEAMIRTFQAQGVRGPVIELSPHDTPGALMAVIKNPQAPHNEKEIRDAHAYIQSASRVSAFTHLVRGMSLRHSEVSELTKIPGGKTTFSVRFHVPNSAKNRVNKILLELYRSGTPMEQHWKRWTGKHVLVVWHAHPGSDTRDMKAAHYFLKRHESR